MEHLWFDQSQCSSIGLSISSHCRVNHESIFDFVHVLSENCYKLCDFEELLSLLHTKVVQKAVHLLDFADSLFFLFSFEHLVVLVEKSGPAGYHFLWIHKSSEVELELVNIFLVEAYKSASDKFVESLCEAR